MKVTTCLSLLLVSGVITDAAQLGPRPFWLVDQMLDSDLKDELSKLSMFEGIGEAIPRDASTTMTTKQHLLPHCLFTFLDTNVWSSHHFCPYVNSSKLCKKWLVPIRSTNTRRLTFPLAIAVPPYNFRNTPPLRTRPPCGWVPAL